MSHQYQACYHIHYTSIEPSLTTIIVGVTVGGVFLMLGGCTALFCYAILEARRTSRSPGGSGHWYASQGGNVY